MKWKRVRVIGDGENVVRTIHQAHAGTDIPEKEGYAGFANNESHRPIFLSHSIVQLALSVCLSIRL